MLKIENDLILKNVENKKQSHPKMSKIKFGQVKGVLEVIIIKI
jgi:hypothetical protein